MRRRQFVVTFLATGACCAASSAERVWRIGLLETTSPALNEANVNALLHGLEAQGYVQGQNLAIEYRSADGQAERFPELAAELVRLNVDLILTRGTPAVVAARRATATLPIVMAASGEPADTGVVSNLAHPGGNVTGLSPFNTGLELKPIELLREIVPATKRLGGLYNLANPVLRPRWSLVSESALAQGLEPVVFDVRAPTDLEPAFRAARAAGVDALTIGMDALAQAHGKTIADFAALHQIPTIYPSREFTDQGGLISYSVSYPDLYFRAAAFVDKLLKGAKAADLPVEQPTKFELVINLKTARALGLTIPPTLLARADEVIE